MALPATLERHRMTVYDEPRNDLQTVAMAVDSVADQLTMAQAAILAATNKSDFKGDPYIVYSAIAQMLGDAAQTLSDANDALFDMPTDEEQAQAI